MDVIGFISDDSLRLAAEGAAYWQASTAVCPAGFEPRSISSWIVPPEPQEPEPVAYALRPPLGMNMARGWIFYWDRREAEAAARVNTAWELVPLYTKPPG